MLLAGGDGTTAVGLFVEVLRKTLSSEEAAALVVINLCDGRCASESGRQELCTLTSVTNQRASLGHLQSCRDLLPCWR